MMVFVFLQTIRFLVSPGRIYVCLVLLGIRRIERTHTHTKTHLNEAKRKQVMSNIRVFKKLSWISLLKNVKHTSCYNQLFGDIMHNTTGHNRYTQARYCSAFGFALRNVASDRILWPASFLSSLLFFFFKFFILSMRLLFSQIVSLACCSDSEKRDDSFFRARLTIVKLLMVLHVLKYL